MPISRRLGLTQRQCQRFVKSQYVNFEPFADESVQMKATKSCVFLKNLLQTQNVPQQLHVRRNMGARFKVVDPVHFDHFAIKMLPRKNNQIVDSIAGEAGVMADSGGYQFIDQIDQLAMIVIDEIVTSRQVICQSKHGRTKR